MTDKYIRELIEFVDTIIKLVKKTENIFRKSKKLETEGYNDDIIESVFGIGEDLTNIKRILINSKNNPQSIKNLGGHDRFWIWSLNGHIENLIDIDDERLDKESRLYENLKLIITYSLKIRDHSHKILFPGSPRWY